MICILFLLIYLENVLTNKNININDTLTRERVLEIILLVKSKYSENIILNRIESFVKHENISSYYDTIKLIESYIKKKPTNKLSNVALLQLKNKLKSEHKNKNK